MPTTVAPKQEKSYRDYGANKIDNSGHPAPALDGEPAYDKGFGQTRTSIDAASMPDQATGNAGQRAEGKIEEGVPSVTNGPGRIEG